MVRTTVSGETKGDGMFFGVPIVPSKLERPRCPSTFTPRPRVAGVLRGVPRPVSVVVAPAGYGKTMAVVEALGARSADTVAWLSIDAYDSRELSFWAHLVAALDRVRPGISEAVVEANSRVPVPEGDRLVSTVLAALADVVDVVLVLDDIHRLHDPAVWQQLEYFLDRLPPACGWSPPRAR